MARKYDVDTNPTKEDIQKAVMINMELFKLGPVNLLNDEALQLRIQEFFNLYAGNGMKPTLSGLIMTLGIDKNKFSQILANPNTTLVTTRGRKILL